MRVSFVELVGFRGFREKARFDFPSGFVILTGRNGAGKSTVLDAIDFALTGTIDKFAEKRAKGGGLDRHIWWVGQGSPSAQYVRVGFTNDQGDNLVVTRSRDRNVDPPLEKIAAQLCDGPTAEDWPRTLVQTALIRDETLASLSMDLPEQARFEAVRAAIGGLGGPDHSERTGEILAAAKNAKADQAERHEALQEDLGRALSALTEARSVAERQPDTTAAEASIRRLAPDLELSKGDASERLRKRIADRKSGMQTILNLVDEAEELEADRSFFASPEGATSQEQAAARFEDAAQKLQFAQKARAEIAARFTAHQEADEYASQLVALLSHGEEIGLIDGHCPLCDAARTDEEFKLAIDKARSRLSSRGEAASISLRQLREADASMRMAEAAEQATRRALAELNARQAGIQVREASIAARLQAFSLQASASSSSQLRRSALAWQEDTATLEHAQFVLEASSAHDRVTALQARVQELRDALETEAQHAISADRALEAAKLIDSAAKTVANQILTEQFDTVMPLLKELYKRLRPHADWREIETDFGGKIRASLNFTVGEGRNPQFLFSSGQRRAAGLAFLLAIHLSRPWSRLQSLLLDDPVQHIDDYRALNLVEVLTAVRRLGRQIIVAVEDTSLADLLSRRLRSGYSGHGCRYDLAMLESGSAAIEKATQLPPLPSRVLEFSEAS